MSLDGLGGEATEGKPLPTLTKDTNHRTTMCVGGSHLRVPLTEGEVDVLFVRPYVNRFGSYKLIILAFVSTLGWGKGGGGQFPC